MEDKKQFALKIIPKKLLEKPKAKQKVLSLLTPIDAIINKTPPHRQTQEHLRPLTRLLRRIKRLHYPLSMFQRRTFIP